MAKQLRDGVHCNADLSMRVFKAIADLDGGFIRLDPKNANTKLNRARLVFLLVAIIEFIRQCGKPPPNGWFQQYKEMAQRLDFVDLKFRVQDWCLPRDHWYVKEQEAIRAELAKIPMDERRENKRAKAAAELHEAQAAEPQEVASEDNNMTSDGSSAAGNKGQQKRKKKGPWGAGWQGHHTKLAKKGGRGDDGTPEWAPYEWVHPMHNAEYRTSYSSEDNFFFLSLSWRYQDVLLHFDRIQPVDPESVEEFIPL